MKKIRYGVIGTEGIGKGHTYVANENERVELTALVDIDADAVKMQAQELGVRWFTDYRAMLAADIVDAVSIATPHHLHSIIGLACLQAGVHIFVEKPLAPRVSEADALLAAAQAHNLKICVGHQYRLHRSSQAVKNLIDSGAVGHVKRVLWTWSDFRAESYYTRDVWRETFRHAGGGVLMNQVSHDLDLACWMLGQPVQVSAMVGNQLHNVEIEDIACANVLFANGAFGTFQFTINQPRGYSVRQIFGDRGAIIIQDVKSLTSDRDDRILLGTYEDSVADLATTLSDYHAQPAVSWRRVKLPGESIWTRRVKFVLTELGLLKPVKYRVQKTLMDSFINSIIDGDEPIVNGQNTRQTVELINAIYLSALRGKTVHLPLDPQEYDQLFEELSQSKTQVPRLR